MSSLDFFGTPIPFPTKKNARYEKLKTGVISDWILASLKTVASNNIPPTIASRFYFLCGVIIYDALRVIHSSWTLVDLMKDIGSFPYTLPSSDYDAWTEVALYDGFYELYKFINLPIDELDIVSRNHASQYRKIYRMILSQNITTIRQDWKQRVLSYLHLRAKDNSQTASTFSPSSDVPNSGFSISTDMTTALSQDLTTLPQPDLWCPIEIVDNGKTNVQKYLTPQWGEVIGILSESDKSRFVSRISSTFFPSDQVEHQETLKLLEICENLDVKQKLSAEFWAGGPGTFTPPGFWIYFARCCVLTKNLDTAQEAQLFYRMTASLFQVGILAWELKRRHLQRRPIQAIRQLRPEKNVLLYDGTSVSNKRWIPFQESSFVSPPFPDFVSGHSSFSAVGARVLTEFFGTNVIPTSKQLDTTDMKFLSPLLVQMDPMCNLCSLTIYPRRSMIETTIPETGVTLSWHTWDDMADDAGRSRIYGGIHYESSNQGGLALGRNLYNLLFP